MTKPTTSGCPGGDHLGLTGAVCSVRGLSARRLVALGDHAAGQVDVGGHLGGEPVEVDRGLGLLGVERAMSAWPTLT